MQINHCDLYIKNLEKQTLELACQIIFYKKKYCGKNCGLYFKHEF